MKFSHKLLVFALLLCVVFAFAATSAMAATCAHDYEEVAVLRQGSCTVKQITKVQCSKCDDVQYETEYVHGATVTEYTEAECGKNIFVIEVCTLCNEKVSEIELAGTALKHDEYIVNDSTAGYGYPICHNTGEIGKIKMGCHICDETWDVEVTASGAHTWPEKGKVVKTPTCEEPSGTLFYCEVCGFLSNVKGTNNNDQLNHDWEDQSVAPTCAETGIEELWVCKNCSTVDDKRPGREVAKNPENHNPDSIVLIDDSLKPATCTTTGVGKYMCLDCEKTFYGVIAASHDFDYENAVTIEPATCGADGKAEATCKVCSETDEVVLKATGEHPAFEYGYVEGKDCKTLAKAGEFCVVCEALKPDTKYTTVPGAYGPHKIEMVEGSLVEATCDTDGRFDVICTVCKKAETKATETIDKLGHAYGEEHHAEADCENPEAIVKVCANCNDVIVVYEIPDGDIATGHNYVEDYVDGTCVTKGYTYKVCTNCGDTKDKVEDATTNKNNHANKYVVDTLKEATCTTNGIGTYYCPDCKKDLGYQVINAGHKLDKANEVITPATCKEDGKIVNVCTVCNEVVEEKIDATGDHEAEEGHYVPATCAVNAYTVTICKVCGEELSAPAYIEQTTVPHTVSIIRYTHEEATCTDEGKADIYCAVCEQEISNYPLPKLPHAYGEAFIREANCKSPEAIVQVCAECGDEYLIETIGEELGDHDYETKNKLYTCDGTEGYKDRKVCKHCGKQGSAGKKIAVDPENGHDMVIAEVLKAATCTDKGIGKYECSNPDCDKVEYMVTGVKHVLDEGTVIIPANCGKTGKIEYHCTLCDYTESGTLPKVGEHQFDDMVKDATCESDAKAGIFCKVCLTQKSGTTSTDIEGTKLTHLAEYDLIEIETAPDCDNPGKGTAACKYCGEVEDEFVIPALGHDMIKGELLDATCTHGLGYLLSCSRCDHTDVDELDSKKEPHNYVYIDVPATCTTPKIVRQRVCSNCGLVKSEGKQEGDPDTKNGHDAEIVAVLTEATCTKEGIAKYGECSICGEEVGYKAYTAAHDWSDEQYGDGAEAVVYVYCTVCGEIHIVYEDETDCKHNFVEVEAVEPTEEAAGNTAGIKCSECGMILKGCEVLEWKDCEHKNVNEAVLDPETVVEATCETDGSYEMVVTCKDCEEEVSRETVIVPASHKGLVELPAVEATCTTTGLTAGSECTVCGKTVVAQTVLPVADHKAVELPAVAADCLNAGLTAGSKCEVCGRTLTAQTVVPATGHTAVELPAVAPTCTEAGKTAGSECSVCKAVLKVQEEVAALGHTEVEVAAVAPTCTEAGLTAGTKCSVCGVAMKAQEEVAALGHTEVEVPAVAPTCTEAGLTAGTKCSVCGEIVKAQEVVAALGHKEEVVAGKAATCTEAGLTDGAKCTVCGETTKEQVAIEALGHKVVVVPGKVATCDEAGLTEGKKCEVCGTVIEAQEAIEALGHKYVVTWDFNADFTKKVKITTCEACDYEDIKEFELDF